MNAVSVNQIRRFFFFVYVCSKPNHKLMNFPVLLIAAVVPLIIGFLWYSPFLFGNAWMKQSGVSEEKLKSGNMVLILALTFVFSLMLAMLLQLLVIHQANVPSIFVGNPDMNNKDSEVGKILELINTKYAYNYRTFKHGMFHGAMAGVFLALPIFGIIALFERRGWRYILMHAGFWILCLMLMGGVLCQFA